MRSSSHGEQVWSSLFRSHCQSESVQSRNHLASAEHHFSCWRRRNTGGLMGKILLLNIWWATPWLVSGKHALSRCPLADLHGPDVTSSMWSCLQCSYLSAVHFCSQKDHRGEGLHSQNAHIHILTNRCHDFPLDIPHNGWHVLSAHKLLFIYQAVVYIIPMLYMFHYNNQQLHH